MKHQKHQISLDELYNYTIKQEIAGAYGRGEHKTIKVCICIRPGKPNIFEVIDHGEVKISTDDPEKAVEVYNSL